jgi:hypothetical protein
VVLATGGDHVLGVEPRVGPQGQWAGGPGSADPTDQLADEAGTPTPGVGRALPMTDMEDLPVSARVATRPDLLSS